MENIEVVVSSKLLDLRQKGSNRLRVLTHGYITIDWQEFKKVKG